MIVDYLRSRLRPRLTRIISATRFVLGRGLPFAQLQSLVRTVISGQEQSLRLDVLGSLLN